MSICNDQVVALLGLLDLTEKDETDCDDCLRRLAEFAEVSLSGLSIPEALTCIERHLQRCFDCREEFIALKDALRELILLP